MIRYIPVLKSKVTSFRALRQLKTESKVKVTPLFEIVPKTEDDLIKNLRANLHEGAEFFVDFLFFDGNPEVSSLLISKINECVSYKFSPIPIWGPDRTPEYLKGINTLLEQGIKKIGIRLPSDLFLPENEEEIVNSVFELFASRGLEIYVILDFESLNEGNSAIYVAQSVIGHIKQHQYSKIVFIAGTFPNTLEMAEFKGKSVEVKRYDYLSWLALTRSGLLSLKDSCYGDYTIRDIGLPYSGVTKDKIPTLRYTTDETFYISRGISHRKHKDRMNQFNQLCKELIDKPFYRGMEFSDGDRIIFEKGTGIDSAPGNPATWAQIGINQHIEFVVHQLE
ncbi:MAG: beta family protein [Spirochaetia bacterium]|nr:beta family protein [Spirochaetia bacterium]MCE1208126.1 beta family protein [Spirochaetia bacterium]